MSQLLQEFGVPLKVLLWGYIAAQVFGVILFLVILFAFIIPLFRSVRKDLFR